MRRAWWDSKTNPWVNVVIAAGWALLSALSFANGALPIGIVNAAVAVAWGCLAVAAFLRRRRLAERARSHPDEDAPA